MNDYTLDEIWNRIQESMLQNPAPISELNIVYQFDLIDEENGSYQLHLFNGNVEVIRDHFSEPGCTLKMKTAHFKDLLLGKLSGAAAFLTGRLKVKGNMGLALKLDQILSHYDVKNLL
ncbi:MAG TPA: SCP2 sterol-binding domain-containing protein [Candidatus Angelobacter sp.]|nr:SCP2 sterol-binding domain-containing protein [Candidatus Angelobacter sp.]